MSFKSIATGLIMIAVSSALLYAGCGGGDSSPTRPTEPTTPTPTPTPPPAPTVSRIEVSPNMVTLEVGRTQQLAATAKASDGAVISGVNYTWSSSNTAVVNISAGGLATAVSVGTATIRATGNGIVSEPATITVTVAAVARVTISPSSTQELMVGEMVTFTATARTSGGALLGDVSVTWASSDTSIVTITSAGVATAVAAGTATVRATADGIASSPVTINVAEPPPPAPVVSSVTVSPPEATIEEGATQQFTAMALTSDGMEVPDAEFTWSSTAEMVATVDADGLATGVGAGEAMITATADSISGMATLTVTEPPPPEPIIASVTIMDAMPVMLEIGDTHQLMAVARTSEGNMIGGVMFEWSSDDNEVATVDSTGLITAVAAGMADITAMAEEVTSEPVSVTVAEPPPVVDRVSVEPMTASIEVGEMQQFTATAYDSDNEEISGKTFRWTSSQTSVATVSPSSGTATTATGVNAGSTTITITASVDGKSGTATLRVTEPPPPPPVVDRVSVSPSSPSIEEGETQRFTATAYDSDNEEISGKTFMWSSSRTSVATVSPSSGTATTATGVNAGPTTIRAAVDGVSGTATLSVTEPPPPPPVVDRVTVSPSSPSIEEGQTQQFSATAYTSAGMEISGKTITWTSSDTSVATINNSGLATAKDAGSTTIKAEVDGKSDTATLTVTEPPPPPPMLRSRTATISGTSSYPRTAGSVTFEEVAGGQLKLTITGMNTGGGINAHLFLYTSSSIKWRRGPAPDGAKHFGNVTGDTRFSSTFTPSAGETIDSYNHVILHCAFVDMPLGSGSF